MNSSPRPYLNVARLHSTQRGIRSTSSCSTLTHSTGPMPSGKSKTSGSRERRGGVPFAVLPDHRRVEALLDRGPHRERRGEDLVAVVVGHHQVGAVSGAELVDLAEQVVGGVPREDVREPRLHADPDQRQPSGGLPVGGDGELLVSELHACLLVRRLGMRLRQRHRHVEVVGARLERAREDRHVEHRVDGVHHVRDPVLAAQRRHGLLGRRVDLRGDVPLVGRRGLLCSGQVVVGDHDLLEEVTAGRDRGEGGADAAGADEEDLHGWPFGLRGFGTSASALSSTNDGAVTRRCRTSRA